MTDHSLIKQVQNELNRKNNRNDKIQRIKEDPFSEDNENEDPFAYNRLAHFERSASFGFDQDKLGRLNELNHNQVQEVLKGSNYANMRRTSSNFNQNFGRINVNFSKTSNVSPNRKGNNTIASHKGNQVDLNKSLNTQNNQSSRLVTSGSSNYQLKDARNSKT